jgi:hypothetical protein
VTILGAPASGSEFLEMGITFCSHKCLIHYIERAVTFRIPPTQTDILGALDVMIGSCMDSSYGTGDEAMIHAYAYSKLIEIRYALACLGER